ncbi:MULTISPECIES: hypothetical protein [unclassified Variovorax]|uniref:hypothetical protein n=1 Tax=unclassified Variovorax TaxID=663243 RepID=UPI0029BFB0F2|nr:hypothetical protein [Variovorax boronicumulans]WPG36222.1 hypothetical protein RZE79_22380 [Variovorax boronicumulans]
MDKQTCKNHIAVLKKVRGACDSQLDSGVKVELDAVIEALQQHLESRTHGADVATLSLRALQIIAVIVSIVTNIRSKM